jgi:hypothetical protein
MGHRWVVPFTAFPAPPFVPALCPTAAPVPGRPDLLGSAHAEQVLNMDGAPQPPSFQPGAFLPRCGRNWACNRGGTTPPALVGPSHPPTTQPRWEQGIGSSSDKPARSSTTPQAPDRLGRVCFQFSQQYKNFALHGCETIPRYAKKGSQLSGATTPPGHTMLAMGKPLGALSINSPQTIQSRCRHRKTKCLRQNFLD